MKKIHVDTISDKVASLFVKANISLGEDMKKNLKDALAREDNTTLSHEVLEVLNENYKIAEREKLPLCQDTGMGIVFIRVGQDVHIYGGALEDAINKGIKTGYERGYLRKSIVDDPLYERRNTMTNTPGIIHYEVIPGDRIEIVVLPKGGGAENTSRLVMGNPSWGEKEIIDFVLETVKLARGKACPPIILGIGIGGSFDYVGYLAKKALIRPLNASHPDEKYRKLEEKLLKLVNDTGIGAGGLGGKVTCLKVNIETYPTHIASLPLAVNIQCNAHRIRRCVI